MGRLAIQATPATRFVYDGSDLIAETDAANNILRRYVHIPGTDNVLVWYEGADTLNRRWLAHDERGSTTLITDATGNNFGINAYDEYGIPQSTNLGRFQYTGQTWLPELGMYYYKARIYSPTMGRFMQTDPKGYDDGPNWYNYVHGDPMNLSDPMGNDGIPNWILQSIQNQISSQIRNSMAADSLRNFAVNRAMNAMTAWIDGHWEKAKQTTFDLAGADMGAIAQYKWIPSRAVETVFTYTPPALQIVVTTIASGIADKACHLIGLLGDSGRLRLGADLAGGAGAFVKAGAGMSLRGDGSLEFDGYLGGGVGGGIYGGAGLDIDNGGGRARGFHGSLQTDASVDVGYGSGSLTGTVPFKTTDNGLVLDAPQASGGLGAGPKVGFAGGVGYTGTATYRTGGLCS